MNDEVENSKQQKKILLEYKNPSRVAFLSYEPVGWEKSSDHPVTRVPSLRKRHVTDPRW